MQKQRLIRMRRRNGEEGFTLLEYAAGAVVLLGGAYLAMSTFSDSLGTYFSSVSGWVSIEATKIPGNTGG